MTLKIALKVIELCFLAEGAIALLGRKWKGNSCLRQYMLIL